MLYRRGQRHYSPHPKKRRPTRLVQKRRCKSPDYSIREKHPAPQRHQSRAAGEIRRDYKVTKVWKGEAIDTIALEVGPPEHSSCGTYFAPDHKYIIFAYGNTTHLCTINQYLEHSYILGVLRYQFEESFQEKLGQNNKKKLNEQEAFYLNNKLKHKRGNLDFREARVIFINRKKRVRKKEYFSQWGATMYQETLKVIHIKRRWLTVYDAIISMNPIRN
jgi:hypothetical protein